jgi:hypothetical protein
MVAGAIRPACRADDGDKAVANAFAKGTYVPEAAVLMWMMLGS